MFRKTDKVFKRSVSVWERGYVTSEKTVEIVRREIWWFLILPLYSRETIEYNKISY